MTLATLADVLGPALRDGYAVPGFVCLGWEDMRAFVQAAEAERAPVILQAGPGARQHTPLPVLAAMMRTLASETDVPVVVHLDHGSSLEECRAALDLGFTSVMFDGSRHALSRNIEETAAVAELARGYGAGSEGEIGFVGYADGPRSRGTDPQEAMVFVRETGVDAVAVSVGNVHLQQDFGGSVDMARLRAIEAATECPLVIHGGSGVPRMQRAELAKASRVCKFNMGTELRMAFGTALREAVSREASRFDRIEILRETEGPVRDAARRILRELSAAGRAGGVSPSAGTQSAE